MKKLLTITGIIAFCAMGAETNLVSRVSTNDVVKFTFRSGDRIWSESFTNCTVEVASDVLRAEIKSIQARNAKLLQELKKPQ